MKRTERRTAEEIDIREREQSENERRSPKTDRAGRGNGLTEKVFKKLRNNSPARTEQRKMHNAANVCRNREWHREHPTQDISPRQIGSFREPRHADAREQCATRHSNDQQERIAKQFPNARLQ